MFDQKTYNQKYYQKDVDGKEHNKRCPSCGKEQSYKTNRGLMVAIRENRKCGSCALSGKFLSDEHKKQLGHIGNTYCLGRKQCLKEKELRRVSNNRRFENPEERERTSRAIKIAMHRPDVRKRHIDALHQSQWLKVKTDKGQLELLEKWNGLGFKFEPNYQVHTDTDLFYVDGFDKEHGVVLEYDSKYHNTLGQQKKDLIRQNILIDVLKPKKFWRYNAVNKSFEDVLKGKTICQM